jgi:HlyD family secretion protein
MRYQRLEADVMRRVFRWLLIIGLVAALALGLVFVLQGQENPDAQSEPSADIIDAALAERGTLRVAIGATGAAAPVREVGLSFELPGIVAEVLVSEGETVSAGQPLARLNADSLAAAVRDAELLRDLRRIAFDALTTPPREVDIAAAQAVVDAARAQLAAAYNTASPEQAEIARIQADLARNQLWQAQLQRDLAVSPAPLTFTIPDLGIPIPTGVPIPPGIPQPGETIVIPQQGADPRQFEGGLEQAEIGVQAADARALAAANRGADAGAVASANAALVAAQTTLDRLLNGATENDRQMVALELQQAEIGVQLAQANFDRSLLRAPFDAVVARMNLTVGEPAPQTQPALLVIDTRSYYLDLAIDEADIGRITVGQRVEIDLDALPDAALTGTVTRIAIAPPPLDPIAQATQGQQVVTYTVRVTFDPTDAPLRAGMTATASILTDERTDVLILPNRFIRIDRESGSAFVTIESGGGFRELPVTLGARSETESEIVSGVEEGQRVVLVPRAVFDPVAANTGQGQGR